MRGHVTAKAIGFVGLEAIKVGATLRFNRRRGERGVR